MGTVGAFDQIRQILIKFGKNKSVRRAPISVLIRPETGRRPHPPTPLPPVKEADGRVRVTTQPPSLAWGFLLRQGEVLKQSPGFGRAEQITDRFARADSAGIGQPSRRGRRAIHKSQ
jgi:hypothetical protein